MKKLKCCGLLNLPVVRRKLVCVVMGLGFGFLGAWGSTHGAPELAMMPEFWWSDMMWLVVFNRFLLAMVIFLAGGFVWCPVSGIRLFPWTRGGLLGLLVSLDLSLGMSSAGIGGDLFWNILICGVIGGAVIDYVATRWGGEGEKLLDSCCEREEKKWFWQK